MRHLLYKWLCPHAWRYWRELHQSALRERDMWNTPNPSEEQAVREMNIARTQHLEETIMELREQIEMAAEWLESRPDFTEGDAATSSSLRAALVSTPDPQILNPKRR